MGGKVDIRNIRSGWVIPTRTYSDQPNVVKTDDGAWLCVLTTGADLEGKPGQHVISTRSQDGGIQWRSSLLKGQKRLTRFY
jgi:hypothetical protein